MVKQATVTNNSKPQTKKWSGGVMGEWALSSTARIRFLQERGEGEGRVQIEGYFLACSRSLSKSSASRTGEITLSSRLPSSNARSICLNCGIDCVSPLVINA